MSKQKKQTMTKSEAAGVLSSMLHEHEYSAAFIDFDSAYDKEIQAANAWKKRRDALKTAIDYLKGSD